MGNLTLEVGPTRTSTCEHCQGPIVRTSGFVYSDGDAHAIYHATLHPDPISPHMDLAIGISDGWDVEGSTADVSGFLRVWPSETDIKSRFVDPAESELSTVSMLAHQLSATAARESASRTELLRIAELVIDADPAVEHHLRHGAPLT